MYSDLYYWRLELENETNRKKKLISIKKTFRTKENDVIGGLDEYTFEKTSHIIKNYFFLYGIIKDKELISKEDIQKNEESCRINK